MMSKNFHKGQRRNRRSVSALPPEAYTSTSLVMVERVKAGGRAPHPHQAWLDLPSWWKLRQKVSIVSLCVYSLCLWLCVSLGIREGDVFTADSEHTIGRTVKKMSYCTLKASSLSILYFSISCCASSLACFSLLFFLFRASLTYVNKRDSVTGRIFSSCLPSPSLRSPTLKQNERDSRTYFFLMLFVFLASVT